MEETSTRKHSLRNAIFILIGVLIAAFAGYKLVSGYIATLPRFTYSYGDFSADSLAVYPDAHFAVLSDLHYYDTSLGTTGAAFEKTMNTDRKLLQQSAQLLDMAIGSIMAADVKFVLISGDLTKDGERINHLKAAQALQQLVDSGIKVYVTPGNHDVNNPGAVRYAVDGTEPVETVSEADFAEIYANCGFNEAILRDPDSLSYVAEPQEGLWILALDTCLSEHNSPGKRAIVAGELGQPQLNWVQGVLTQAQEQGKAVILLQHHGLVEHWRGQSRLHPDYLLRDYAYAGQFFASYGVRLAFTGHYHAQDIALEDYGAGSFIYDVETGALVTPPCSMRFCTISDNSITLNSQYLIEPYGAEFKAQAMAFVKRTIYDQVYGTLRRYHVSKKDAAYLADSVASAYAIHYAGNEAGAESIAIDPRRLNLWGRLAYSRYAYVIRGLTQDLPPADSDCSFSLATAP